MGSPTLLLKAYHLAEAVQIAVGQQQNEHAKAHHFTVQVARLNMGPGGERIKHGVRQAGIVIHNMLCRQQNRGNAGGDDDSQNHLLHC